MMLGVIDKEINQLRIYLFSFHQLSLKFDTTTEADFEVKLTFNIICPCHATSPKSFEPCSVPA